MRQNEYGLQQTSKTQQSTKFLPNWSRTLIQNCFCFLKFFTHLWPYNQSYGYLTYFKNEELNNIYYHTMFEPICSWKSKVNVCQLKSFQMLSVKQWLPPSIQYIRIASTLYSFILMSWKKWHQHVCFALTLWPQPRSRSLNMVSMVEVNGAYKYKSGRYEQLRLNSLRVMSNIKVFPTQNWLLAAGKTWLITCIMIGIKRLSAASKLVPSMNRHKNTLWNKQMHENLPCSCWQAFVFSLPSHRVSGHPPHAPCSWWSVSNSADPGGFILFLAISLLNEVAKNRHISIQCHVWRHQLPALHYFIITYIQYIHEQL